MQESVTRCSIPRCGETGLACTIWLRRLDFADLLIWRQASERLEPLGEVVGHEEGVDVRLELGVRPVMP